MRLVFWTPARRSAFLVVASTLVASAIAGGCIIVTGGTGDYELVEAGPREAGPACVADAECVSLTCLSTADCDAGEACCVTASGVSTLISSCQVGRCPAIQLCGTSSDCGDGGATCTSQHCPAGGVSLTLQSCGAITGCSP